MKKLSLLDGMLKKFREGVKGHRAVIIPNASLTPGEIPISADDAQKLYGSNEIPIESVVSAIDEIRKDTELNTVVLDYTMEDIDITNQIKDAVDYPQPKVISRYGNNGVKSNLTGDREMLDTMIMHASLREQAKSELDDSLRDLKDNTVSLKELAQTIDIKFGLSGLTSFSGGVDFDSLGPVIPYPKDTRPFSEDWSKFQELFLAEGESARNGLSTPNPDYKMKGYLNDFDGDEVTILGIPKSFMFGRGIDYDGDIIYGMKTPQGRIDPLWDITSTRKLTRRDRRHLRRTSKKLGTRVTAMYFSDNMNSALCLLSDGRTTMIHGVSRKTVRNYVVSGMCELSRLTTKQRQSVVSKLI